MNGMARHPRLLSVVAAFIALLLHAIPLPHLIDLIRPDFLLLIVIWFALMMPRIGGLGFAWLSGLILDAVHGVVLGENALTFVVIAYIVQHLHLRMRMYPLLHQTMAVMSLLGIYQFLMFWIDGVTGHPMTLWVRWLPILTGAICWPLLSGLLGRYSARN